VLRQFRVTLEGVVLSHRSPQSSATVHQVRIHSLSCLVSSACLLVVCDRLIFEHYDYVETKWITEAVKVAPNVYT